MVPTASGAGDHWALSLDGKSYAGLTFCEMWGRATAKHTSVWLIGEPFSVRGFFRTKNYVIVSLWYLAGNWKNVSKVVLTDRLAEETEKLAKQIGCAGFGSSGYRGRSAQQ